MTSKANAISQLKRQAKNGDPQAIATLMNRSFKRRGVTAIVTAKGNCLQVLLESSLVPRQSTFVSMIWMGVHKLAIADIHTLEIYGKQLGNDIPCWSQKIFLDRNPDPDDSPQSLQVGDLVKDSLGSSIEIAPLGEPLPKATKAQLSSLSKDSIKHQQPNFLNRFLSRFNLRAAIYGLLMDIIGTEGSSFVLTVIFSAMLAMQGKNYDRIQSELASSGFLIVYTLFGIIFSGAGGFLAARWAKHDEILNAALTGIISTSLGWVMTYTVQRASPPSLLQITALLLTIPMAIVGGWIGKISVKQQIQVI